MVYFSLYRSVDIENFREKANESNTIQFLSEVQRPDIRMSHTYPKPAITVHDPAPHSSKDWHRNSLLELFPQNPSFLSYQRNCVCGTCMFTYSQISWSNWISIRMWFCSALKSGNFALDWSRLPVSDDLQNSVCFSPCSKCGFWNYLLSRLP